MRTTDSYTAHGDSFAAGGTLEPFSQSVSWQAILAGSLAAMATSIIMLALGSGLGLSTLWPWYNAAHPITTITFMTAIWLIIMQLSSSFVGGYVTGRLRTKWTGLTHREVLYRDITHGFLTWGLATFLTATIFVTGATALVGGTVNAATHMAASATMPSIERNPVDYFVDSLFRTPTGTVEDVDEARREAMQIFTNAMTKQTFPEADKAYLATVIAAETGLSTTEARSRLDTVITDLNRTMETAAQTADSARKTTSRISLLIFFSMLVGVFVSGVGARIGGRQRDR